MMSECQRETTNYIKQKKRIMACKCLLLHENKSPGDLRRCAQYSRNKNMKQNHLQCRFAWLLGILGHMPGMKSLLGLPMLAMTTLEDVVVPLLEALPWPFSVPLFTHRWKQ